MDLLKKHEKKLVLASCTLFALALLADIPSELNFFSNTVKYYYGGPRAIIIISNILSLIISGCTTIAFLAYALVHFKTGKYRIALAAGGGLMLIGKFISLILYIIQKVSFGGLGLGDFVKYIFSNAFPTLLAVAIIVLAFLKLKGPIVPIVSAVIIGIALLGVIPNIFEYLIPIITNIKYYTNLRSLLSVFSTLLGFASSSLFYLGLLTLVPTVTYIPQTVATETEPTQAENN